MHFKSDISSISSRAGVILGLLAVFWYVLFLIYVGFGIKTGHLYASTIAPIKENLSALLESMEESSESSMPVPRGTDASVEIEINNSVKISTAEGIIEYQQKDLPQAQPTIVYYVYPTAVPGQPGSTEWSEQFWKDWNETKSYIDDKNSQVQQSQEEFMKNFEQQKLENEAFKQKVEESQRKFCEENPDLCN